MPTPQTDQARWTKGPEGNLRGRSVRFTHPETGRWIFGVVVTRIRDTRWLVESALLPASCERPSGVRRITLDRSQFQLAPPAASVRRARTPLEAAIDRACGLAQVEGPQG